MCIVGGGFTGLWTAIQAKQQNPALDIVIVEADLCGAGASGRNGGCLLTWSAKFLTLRRLFGEAEAIRLVKASEAAVQHIADFCRAHAIDAELRLDGTLYTATSRAQVGTLAPVLDALAACGIHSYEPLSPAEVARRSGSARNLDGVYSPIAATVHPGKLVRGCAAWRSRWASGSTNARRCSTSRPGTGGRAHAVRHARGQARVRDQRVDGEPLPAVRAHDRGRVERHGHHREMPGAAREDQLVDGASVLDSRIFVYYYRTTADGRLMLGKGGNTFSWRSRIAPVFDRRSPYEAQLTQSLRAFFPSLAGVPVTASWNGPSDRSVTGFPFFGRFDDAPNVFYGFGYSGNGVGPAYMGGQILSSLVLGLDNAWTRSPIVRGPLGHFRRSRSAMSARTSCVCDPPQGARGGREPAAGGRRHVAREIRERGREGRQGVTGG